MTPRPRRTRRPLATSPFAREVTTRQTTEGFSIGDRVTHDRRGMGRVTKVTEEYVVVDFGTGEECHVLADTPGFSRL